MLVFDTVFQKHQSVVDGSSSVQFRGPLAVNFRVLLVLVFGGIWLESFAIVEEKIIVGSLMFIRVIL